MQILYLLLKIEAIHTKKERINTNSISINNAQQELAVLQKKRDIGATTIQTATTGLDTAATKGNAASKNILTAASAQATAACN